MRCLGYVRLNENASARTRTTDSGFGIRAGLNGFPSCAEVTSFRKLRAVGAACTD